MFDRTVTALTPSVVFTVRERSLHITTNTDRKDDPPPSTETNTPDVDKYEDWRSCNTTLEERICTTTTAAAAASSNVPLDAFRKWMVSCSAPMILPLEITTVLAASLSRTSMPNTARRCGHPRGVVRFTRNDTDPPTTPIALRRSTRHLHRMDFDASTRSIVWFTISDNANVLRCNPTKEPLLTLNVIDVDLEALRNISDRRPETAEENVPPDVFFHPRNPSSRTEIISPDVPTAERYNPPDVGWHSRNPTRPPAIKSVVLTALSIRISIAIDVKDVSEAPLEAPTTAEGPSTTSQPDVTFKKRIDSGAREEKDSVVTCVPSRGPTVPEMMINGPTAE
jgi:hypothetical protein